MHTCGLSGPERPRVPPEGAPGRVGYVRGSRAGRPGLGQSPELFEAAVSRLAHLRGQPLPRDRGQPRSHLVGAYSPDPLTGTPLALEPAANPDLERSPLGRREDGGPPFLRLLGTHLLVAGATGSGRARWCGHWSGGGSGDPGPVGAGVGDRPEGRHGRHPRRRALGMWMTCTLSCAAASLSSSPASRRTSRSTKIVSKSD